MPSTINTTTAIPSNTRMVSSTPGACAALVDPFLGVSGAGGGGSLPPGHHLVLFIPLLQGKPLLLLGQVLAQVQRHGDDDHQALHNVGVAGLDAHELHGDFQQLKHQHADQNAADLAYAAVDGYAADGAARDGLQLVAHGGVHRRASARQPVKIRTGRRHPASM